MEEQREPSSLTSHVVVCNVNEKVRAIVEQLRNNPAEKAVDVVIIVQDAKLWLTNPDWHPPANSPGIVLTVFGCPALADTLRRANISDARAAIILADPKHGLLADARSALIGISIERENPQVHTVMELILSINRSHLRATDVDEVVCLGEISEKLLSQSAVTPGVSKLFATLLTSEVGTAQLFIRTLPNALEGSTYRQLARRAIRKDAAYIVCGFTRPTEARNGNRRGRVIVFNPRVDTEPGKDSRLFAGDSLILLASDSPDLSMLTT